MTASFQSKEKKLALSSRSTSQPLLRFTPFVPGGMRNEQGRALGEEGGCNAAQRGRRLRGADEKRRATGGALS